MFKDANGYKNVKPNAVLFRFCILNNKFIKLEWLASNKLTESKRSIFQLFSK